MYPWSTSSCSSPQCTSISTSPSVNFALQVQHMPPLHANGRSAPCFNAASSIVVSLFSERSKSKLLPSSRTVILLRGPSATSDLSLLTSDFFFCPDVVNNSKCIFFSLISFCSKKFFTQKIISSGPQINISSMLL